MLFPPRGWPRDYGTYFEVCRKCQKQLMLNNLFLLSSCLSTRADPNRAKRQKRQELKRAAEWENATGVITGGQAALDKAVRTTKILEIM